MHRARMPAPLAERLGDEASASLLEMFEEQIQACADYVMMQTTERFERRLIEETSKLRLEMAHLRQEMHDGFAAVRQEMHAGRFDLLKWAFVFWVGQLVSVAGIVGLLLRTVPAR